MFIYITILALGIIGFFIHLMVSKQPKSPAKIAELFLLYQMIFSVSLSSFLAFFGLSFMTEFVAKYSGWSSSRFEELLGNVNFSYGILGLLAIWIRGHFWTAIVLGQSIWLMADAGTHMLDIFEHQNYTPGNAGVPLYTDILIPVVLLISLGFYLYLNPSRQPNKSEG